MNHRNDGKNSPKFRLLGLALLFILFTIGQGFGQPFDPTAWNLEDGWDQIPEIQMPETQDPFNFVHEFETTNFVQEDNQIRYPETPTQPQNRDANTYDVNLDGTTISHETIPGSDRWGVQIEKDYGSTQLSGTIWVIVGGGLSPSIPLGWVGQNIAIGDRVNIGGRYDPETHSVTLYGNAGYYMRLLSKQPTPNPEPNPEPYPEPTPEPYPKPNPEPVTVNQPPSVLELIPNKGSPQNLGSAIDWTATASDPDSGDTIYYKFMINNAATNSQWQDMTVWSTSNTWTWSPTGSDIGENYIGFAVRDGNHAAEDDYDDFKQMAYNISQENQPPKITNIYSDLASPQKVGSTIVWTADASDPDNGDAIYYKFRINNNATNGQWQDMTGWSDSNTCPWSPTSSDIGKNSIGVIARDGKHAHEDDYDSYMGDYFDIIEDNQPPRLNSITASLSSPQNAGTPVTWTADASDTDPGDTIYYKFMLSGQGTSNQYRDMTGWITTSTWTWNPYSADVGRNSIDVLIRDGKHAPESDHDANLEAYFDIAKENQPPTVTSLTPDQASPQKAGTTITWTAKASDPENDTLQYQFTLDGKVVADWSNSEKWAWSSSEEDIGSKKVGVAVKDGNHAINDNSDDIRYASFDITASQTPQPVSLTIVRGRVIKIPECQPSKNGESCYFGIRILEVISNPMNLPTIATNKTISIHYNSDSQSMTPLNINDCVEIAARWDGDLYCSPEYSGEHVTKIDCPEGMPRCDDPWNPNLKPGIKCVDNTIYKEIIYPDCTRQWMIYDNCSKYNPPRQCIDGKCVEGNGCEPGFTGIRKCQDDKVIGLYKNADCSEDWKIEDDCSKYTPPRICENGKCVLQSQCKNDEHPPELYDPRVTPDCGKKGSKFTFSVIYKDEDGDLPSVANIWIRGFEFGGTRRVYDDGYYHDMMPHSDNEDVIKGARYYYSVELPADGEYYYWIYFTNTKGCRVDLPSDSASSETLGLIGPKVKDDCSEEECENALKFKGKITEIIPPETPDSSSGVGPCIFNISVGDPSIDTNYIIAKSWEGCKGLEIGKCVEVYGCYYVVGFPENRWGVDIKREPYYIAEVPCSTEYVDIKFNGTAIKFHKGEMPGAPDYWTVKVDQPIISGPQPCSEQLDVVTYQAINVDWGYNDSNIQDGDHVEVYGQYRLKADGTCDVVLYGSKEYYIKKLQPNCSEITFHGTCLEVKDMCWGSPDHQICPYWVIRADGDEFRSENITVYAGLSSTKGDFDPTIVAGDKVEVYGCSYGNNVSITSKEYYYIKKQSVGVDISFNGTAIKFHKGEMPGAPGYWTVKVDQPIISGPQPCSEQLDVITYQAINVDWGYNDTNIQEGDQVEIYGQYRLKADGTCDVVLYGSKEYYIKKIEHLCNGIISGIALDELTKQPISGVVLEISGLPRLLTEFDGSFVFSGLCPLKEYGITCWLDGYETVTKDISTDEDGNAHDIDIYMGKRTNEGPLNAVLYQSDPMNPEIWIKNPAPYFTYIPTAFNGEPNIIIKGDDIEDVSLELKKAGPYGAINNVEELYKIYEKIDEHVFYIKIFTNPPGSLTESVEIILDATSRLISTDDLSLEGNLLALLKESVDIDQNAYYIFINWFLGGRDPIWDIVDKNYYSTLNNRWVWYKGVNHPSYGLASNIETDNMICCSDPNGKDDLFWPRGWESYKTKYLPPAAKGFVLAPDMALVIKLKLSSSSTVSPPASTNPRKVDVKIQRYQSLETIETAPNRPSTEYLQNNLRLYLPVISGGSPWGDEKDMVETLSCIYNGNYSGSEFCPNNWEYTGTTFDSYKLSTSLKYLVQ